MKLKKLKLKKFGPFYSYDLNLDIKEEICLLITGKNNEGKSNIILSLKLLDAAFRVINKKRYEIRIESTLYYEFLKQDTEDYLIRRLIYNYGDETAIIEADFFEDLQITIYINPILDKVYCDFDGRIEKNTEEIFGFIPPLGPIAENENMIKKISYLKANFNTSLAPRHFRNQLAQILSSEDFALIKEIIRNSWKGIQLVDYSVDYFNENRISCFFKEKGFEREISWAGQGLQVWFQIITNLVRLRSKSILVLDEPEINLHPEKQNDLIRIIKQYFGGSIIIATHSVELMNNVNISHIIHVKKTQRKPKIKLSSDKRNLEIIRSHIGSNFNFITSQFEEVDLILFTENVDDYKYVSGLAKKLDIKKRVFNIPLYGFSEYKKAQFYKSAYKLLIGKEINYSVLLDRDYYPMEYLNEIKKELKEHDIEVFYSYGKEIENMFLIPEVLDTIFAKIPEFKEFENNLYSLEEKIDSQGSLVKLCSEFYPRKTDTKTIIKKVMPSFEKQWDNKKKRHQIISGKYALGKIRDFYRERTDSNLSDKILTETLAKNISPSISRLIQNLFKVEQN